MGGSEGKRSKNFKRFEAICCDLFNVCRKNANLFINMMSLVRATPPFRRRNRALSYCWAAQMFPLQLEELQTQADLGYMERVFVLDQTDEEAAAVRPNPQMFCATECVYASNRRRGFRLRAQTFKALITKSLGTMMTKINWTAHIIAHS